MYPNALEHMFEVSGIIEHSLWVCQDQDYWSPWGDLLESSEQVSGRAQILVIETVIFGKNGNVTSQ